MSESTVVFLDANIIARPVTRTLLMMARKRSGLVVVWSEFAEMEATAHMGARAATPCAVREAFGVELSPRGTAAERFVATSASDRQILADAERAGAHFLVTGDVDDFGNNDLVETGISAVDPDLFLSIRMTCLSYLDVINLWVETQTSPRRTAEQIHASLARVHPRLFAVHAATFDAQPVATTNNPPTVIFRGSRCLLCEETTFTPNELVDGLCPSCRP